MTEPTIDHNGVEPLYRQLANLLRHRITTGELRPGQMIPSETFLEQEYGISRNTVRKAVQLLRDVEGLVVTSSGRGSFVNPDYKAPRTQ